MGIDDRFCDGLVHGWVKAGVVGLAGRLGIVPVNLSMPHFNEGRAEDGS